MKAEFKGYRIFDCDNPEEWSPEDPEDFEFGMDFYAGPEGMPGADAFTVTVCTPGRCFRSHVGPIVSAQNTVFMERFDLDLLVDFLRTTCVATEGETWNAIAAQLTRLGRWEFDYRL